MLHSALALILNCTAELNQSILGDPCAHNCFASFTVPQNRADLPWTPCSGLCRNFPFRLNMHMQQLTNNSIPDVMGTGWNFLIPHTTKPDRHKLLITDRVREAARKTGWK